MAYVNWRMGADHVVHTEFCPYAIGALFYRTHVQTAAQMLEWLALPDHANHVAGPGRPRPCKHCPPGPAS